ncbi:MULTISPECIES: hypothetical protein [Sinorhizobium]|uniref:Type I restriction-modification system methyltransferase subunit n=2 Tax=Sinorhizobium TaxID=28105 RepID=A0A2S3YU29_9HYPH|nr:MULTISPECIES: hypothetical protein [Sinorhizobium]AUX75282.1 hypothetical protein NXT3_CH00679 [Sinorhizobium fredii]PDT38859.1 hypothetical protein CO656_22985 [Sinorhizobium sp. FG01]PDT51059.1 hypothetical protein CO664_23680 [Sinorhizobium sp. NG07B]POH25424.1 hypothetical protein ATY30_28005 [Sinorhizobium americanum]POH35127.1 hypothetical protein ATY31_03925 [Sinorhizobium americanum]
MLKLVLTGVWVCAVTLGSVYFSMQYASAPVLSDAEADRRASEEYVPGEIITVPVIEDGAVQGYFLAKLSFSATREGIKKLHAPLRQIVTDELYDMLVGSRFVDVADTGSFDLPSFKVAVKDGLNKKLGGEVITEVLVEQLEYLGKDDMNRAANGEDRPYKEPVAVVDRNGKVAADKIPEGAVKATSGH